MFYLWSVTLFFGVVLQILVVAALLRGGWRRFKVLFSYAVVLLLTTVMEAAAFYNRDIYTRTSRWYWSIDAIRQALIFLLVISLIYAAMGRGEKQAAVRRLVGSGAVLFVALSLYFTRDPRLGYWMTQLSRNLGFLAVILNLILWAVLIQSRSGDRAVLMVSGGMGIQMAGKAIGHSLRQLYPQTTTAGDLIIVLSHLLCLYVWWQAFKGTPSEAKVAREPRPGA